MSPTSKTPPPQRAMLLGSGELGREVAIEWARLGGEVIACDRYDNAPAMQVSASRRVFDMANAEALREAIVAVKPDVIIPEIEALATEVLLECEEKGLCVVAPTAVAAHTTMNRERIRRLVAEKLDFPTSAYRFCDSLAELQEAVADLGTPCYVKPVMSSSGKGQSRVTSADLSSLTKAWEHSQTSGRVKGSHTRVIVESHVPFESEFTLLTVRSLSGVSFCEPIGHVQNNGDYVESWQPHPLPSAQLKRAQAMAETLVNEWGGYGLFGVEFFSTEDEVVFSEVSPRPHDTGLVTLSSQDQSEFSLHARAILGLPIRALDLALKQPSASVAIRATHSSEAPQLRGVDEALRVPHTDVKIFNKPTAHPGRRLGVVLARGNSLSEARERCQRAAAQIHMD